MPAPTALMRQPESLAIEETMHEQTDSMLLDIFLVTLTKSPSRHRRCHPLYEHDHLRRIIHSPTTRVLSDADR